MARRKIPAEQRRQSIRLTVAPSVAQYLKGGLERRRWAADVLEARVARMVAEATALAHAKLGNTCEWLSEEQSNVDLS